MKKWVLMLAISSAALLPFPLRADEVEVENFMPVSSKTNVFADTTKDFSGVIGNPAFVGYIYHFFDRLADLLEDLHQKAGQLVAVYPKEAISQHWEKEMSSIRIFLDNRDEFIKVMSFVGMGIYSENAYTDDETLPQFKKLQSLIFNSLLKCVIITSEYDNEKIDEEAYWDCLKRVEKDVMVQTKAFCLVSKDPFFSESISSFLGDASNRIEAINNIFPSIGEEECFDGTTQAEMSFEDLEDKFNSQLVDLIFEILSPKAVAELLIEMIESAEPEQQ